MAFPTAVNDQITDSVTQTNVSVLAEAPATALACVYQSFAHSLGVLAENAVAQQQAGATLANAVLTASTKTLLG